MVETRMLAQRQHGVLKLQTNDIDGLHCEVSSNRRRHEGRREDEPLEGPEADSVDETREVKVAEDVALAFIYAISEAVCEEGVVCEALDLLDEKPEGKIRGSIEGSG